MPGDNPGNARRPAWKAAAQGPPNKGPRYGWKPEEAPERRSYRRLKQILIGAGAVACVIAMIVIIKLAQRPPHAGLVLFGADPLEDVERLDVPLDAFGWQAERQLTEWANDVAANHRSRWGQLTPEVLGGDSAGPVSLRAKDFPTWAEKLAKSRCDPLVVVFAMHGAAGADGPYLFTAGGERLALREVIDAFAGSRFRDRQVVLILDPARFTPDPTLGILHNDCVRSLKTLEPAIQAAESKLVVICASGPGQRSWDSEEWRTSAFVHAMLDGLRGAAAPANQSIITAWDLFDYVKKQTETWTAINRPTRQTPVMLPDGDKGRERAAAIPVAIKVGDSTTVAPPRARFQAPKELTDRWQEWKDLDTAVPSPAVYTPRLWRRYRELLLRYDQLVRADERPAVAKLSQILHNMSVELDAARGLRRDSASSANALPLSGAYGFVNVTDRSDVAEPKFRKLWNTRSKPADRDALWQELQKEGSADTQRLRLTSFLLRQASDPTGTPTDPDDAIDLLRAVYSADLNAVRPAEAHFALMVRSFDWGGAKPAVPLIRQAVTARMLAERAAVGMQQAGDAAAAYPYSEQVWPVILAAIEEGDNKRRAGEDLLFPNADRWPGEAGKQFDAANTQYDNALKDAGRLQAALAARDRALANLPFLTRWLASLRPEDIRPHDPVALWDKVHELDTKLNDLIRQPDILSDPVRDQLATLTKAVNEPYQRLDDHFREQCRLAEVIAGSRLQQNWQKIEQVLTIPLIDPGMRVKLIESSRQMSAKFNEATSGPAEGAAPTTEEPPRERAQRQGLLALATLGTTILDAQAGPNLLKADSIRERLTDLGNEWEQSVNRAGDQFGRHWQALADPAVEEARSRYAVAFVPPAEDPAQVQRRLRWQRLLVGLARRTFLDHWYFDNRDQEPYYRSTARNFLTDAKELAQAGPDGRKPAVPGLAEVEELLKTLPLKLRAEGEIEWTDQPSRALDYFVTAAPALKGNGFVTLWSQPPSPAGVLTSQATDRRREPVAIDNARRTVRLDLPSSAFSAQVKVGVEGYYRGQRLTGVTAVSLDRTPQRVLTSFAPPDNAGFAVRADQTFQGAIAIVLDYSGSMNQVDRATGKSKYQQMLEVLPKVLAEIPPRTHLSVRLYGHIEPDKMPNAPGANAPEDVVYSFWTPLTPNERIFQEIVESGPKKMVQLDALMKKLTALTPKSYTPLVHTMKQSKANDFPKDFVGPRTLLALTDGADTWYGLNDAQKRSKREFDEAFQDSDITVQLVVFKANASEVKIANEQFGEVVRFLAPGSIEMAENTQSLTDQLDAALRPKLRLVDANGQRVRGVPRFGLPANGADASLNSLRYVSGTIDPGLYNGYVYKSLQAIGFDNGDRLLVRLFAAKEGIRFERDLLARDKLWENRTKAQGDWVLGVPQVRDELNMQGRKLRLMTTVESTVGVWAGKDGVLKQTWPRSVWWEVVPVTEGGPRPGALYVTPLYTYPAPAWELTIDDWADPADPQPRRPRVNVWCQADLPPVVTRVKVTPGVPTPDVELDDGQRVSLTVTLEKHSLYTGVGSRSSQLPAIDCLAVRMRHAIKDRPVQVQLARLPGVAKPAEEHRYYGSVNYSALFGPVTPDQARGKEVELEFVSVAKLKAAATPISFDAPLPLRGEEAPRSFDLKDR